MKKVFQSAMILSLVFLSCTDEADRTENVTGVVGFHAADVTASRAAILTDLKPEGFLVNAYSTGTVDWASVGSATTPGFMYNQAVTWNSGAWTYGTAKYWPGNNGMISFFAWNEGTGATVSGNDKTGAPTLTYTVPNAHAGQNDLVVADALDQTVNTNNGAVALTFDHVLSRIGFTARLEEHYDDVTIRVTSLKVRYAANAVERKGVYTFGKPIPWSFPTTDKVYMSHTTGDGDVVVGGSGVPLNNESPTPAKTYLTSAEAENYLMLLPQTVADGAVTIDVAWTDGVTSNKQSLNLPHQVWLSGKCYDYSLKVSLTRITLDPVLVNPWGDDDLYKPCTITYKANGGTGEDIVEYRTTNVSYPVGDYTFGRDLYRIRAWTTEQGDTYTAGGNIFCTGDMTLYAQWDPAFDGMSNCYMVAPGQALLPFPVRRAYTYEKETFTNTLRTGGTYDGAFEAKVIWDDNNVIQSATVDNTSPGNQAKVNIQAGSQPGNAVVKIIKAGDATETPVWSYHIWVTDYEGDNTVKMKNDHVFMDRNLGATTNDLAPTAYGLLYQWGRKDPFAGGVANSAGYAAQNSFSFGSGNKVDNPTADAAGIAAGIIESIQNPTKFYAAVDNGDWLPARENTLWRASKDTKTIYDPCPAGWRVPAYKDNTATIGNSPWMEYDDTTYAEELASTDPRQWTSTGTQEGYVFKHKDGTEAKYPAVGLRYNSTGHHAGGSHYTFMWTVTADGNNCCNLYYNYAGITRANQNNNRAYGFSVRCVQDKPGP
jgi:uncharacterized protein (TIGR02145 family)